MPFGKQVYTPRPDVDRPVGDNVEHSSGARQVTGEAVYTDDLPRLPNELQAALVTSKRAHAALLSIDTSEALAMPGVRGIYTAADVPGGNLIGDIVVDEPIFAQERVQFVGACTPCRTCGAR